MPALPTLRPTSFVSGTLIGTSTVGNVNDNNDATFIESASGNGVDGQWIYEITDMPADFASMDLAQVTLTIRAQLSATGDDTWRVRGELTDAAGVAVSNVPAYVNLANNTTVQEFTFVLTMTGTNAKAQWNAVKLLLDYQNVKNMAADGNVVRITDAWLTGTYTAASSNRTGSIAQSVSGVSQSATGTVADPVYSGAATQSLQPVSQAATGTAAGPSFDGPIDQTLAPVAQAATGTHVAPLFSGAISHSVAGVTQSAAGTVRNQQGPIVQTLQPVTQAATGTYVEPTDAGPIAQTLEPVTQSATGTHSAPAVATPSNLVATAVGGDRIDLTWDAVAGVDGYDIERDSVIIEWNHPVNSYSDTPLSASTEYSYRVRAVV